MAKYNLGINLATINNNKLIVESANGVSINSGLGVTGDVTLNKALNVLGTSSFKNLLVDGTLTVNDVTTLKKTLNVTGATTLASTLGVTGNATLGGTLTVTGNTTLNGATNTAKALTTTGVLTGNSLVSNTTSTLKGNTTIGGTLGVTGATTVSTLTSTGLMTANSLKVTTTSTLTGAVTASNNLTVAGVTTLNGNTNTKAVTATGLTVNGNESVTGTLTVGGVTTLNGETKTKNLSVTGNETISGALAVTGTGTIMSPPTNSIGDEIVTASWVNNKVMTETYVYVYANQYSSFNDMINYINTINADTIDVRWDGTPQDVWIAGSATLDNPKLKKIIIRLHTSEGTRFEEPTIDSSTGNITAGSTGIIQTLYVTHNIDIVVYADAVFNNGTVYLPLNIVVTASSKIPNLGTGSKVGTKSPIEVTMTLMFIAGWCGSFTGVDSATSGLYCTTGILYLRHIPIFYDNYANVIFTGTTRNGNNNAQLRVSFEKNNGYNTNINILGGTINLYGPGYHNLNNVHFKYPTKVNVYGGAMAFVPNKTNVTFNQAVNTWSTNGIIYDGTLTNP